MMKNHVFVDESKQRGLVLVAVSVSASAVTDARSAMQRLALKKQRRIHFTTESPSRKTQILDVIDSLGVTAAAYVCDRAAAELDARRAALQRLVEDHAACSRLVIELDESMVQHDKRVLFDAVRKAKSEMQYLHMRAYEEALLWIPDAVAWAWTSGGKWRQRVESFTTEASIQS